MATLEDLRDRVSNIILDSQFTDDMIDGYLNDGVLEIAGGLDSAFGDFITPPLPNLFTIETVETGSNAYVSMPDTFQRDLVFVADSKAIEINISNSWIEFMESNPLLSRTGTIYEVVEQAGSLYYQGIPTDPEELTVHFYRFPVDMVEDGDTPDGIPTHLQKQLLVNYACKEIFALIEDGIEGQQVNTMKYLALFQKALRTLEMSIPADTRSLQVGG